jgi:hypothetical protein
MENEKMAVPNDVPQSFKYKQNAFYIRSCYHVYYEQIIQNLYGIDDFDFISVTGTPGIGKSLFYLYFLNRYRADHPAENVLTASFSNQQKFEECKVFLSDGNIKGYNGVPRKFTETWPENLDCSLYLYDGPPDVKPAKVKMVAFTSPSFPWLHAMSKNQSHRTMYMPTWELTELYRANEVLLLNIDKEKISKRYALFGGSARYCLSTCDEFVEEGSNKIREALTKISGVDQLSDCFGGSACLEIFVHCLMHYIPKDNVRFASLVPASESISRMLGDRLIKRLNDERKKLVDWLEGIGKESLFSAWLFETFVHYCLSDGGRFDLRSLADSSITTVEINQTIGQYSRLSTNIALADVFKNGHQMPESSNQLSVDSYMMVGATIMMFKFTRNEKHPVKSSGLIAFLDSLNQLKAVRTNPSVAKLIFVVPKSMGNNFQTQDITFMEELVGEDLQTMVCTEVHGIGKGKSKKLKKFGIHNCVELIDAYSRDDTDIEFVKNEVRTLTELLGKRNEVGFLLQIPQYVFEVDYS